MKYAIFKHDTEELYGVEEVGGGVVYEPEFSETVARRLAIICEDDDIDWSQAERILIREGLLELVEQQSAVFNITPCDLTLTVVNKEPKPC